jgi:hypothetical protein
LSWGVRAYIICPLGLAVRRFFFALALYRGGKISVANFRFGMALAVGLCARASFIPFALEANQRFFEREDVVWLVAILAHRSIASLFD